MTAKELKERLERFEDEEVQIRLAEYHEDHTRYADADMDSVYIRKSGDRVELIFGGHFKTARR